MPDQTEKGHLAGVRLAIADPPYPAFRGSGGRKQRASRWYGDNQRASSDQPADFHADARLWDEDVTHRDLMERLMVEYDGWAIATSPDGLRAYGTLPDAARVIVWVKPNGQPGAHRLRSCWEPVIVYPAPSRRSNRGGRGQIADTLTCPAPRIGFIGAKPPQWTRWVLDALCFDATTDTLDDLFPGSGLVTASVRSSPAAPTTDGSEDIGDELMRRGLSTWGQDGAS